MPPIGAFTFVLHSHLPYARLAGRWPHGEEWIHEAASETYIPLLQQLYDLKEEGVKYKLTVGITPILAEQLADALVLDHFDQFLEDKIAAAKKDMEYFGQQQELVVEAVEEVTVEAATVEEAIEEQPGAEKFPPVLKQEPPPVESTHDPHLAYLAAWYKNWYEDIKQAFDVRFNRDIIGAFKQLQDEGYIEITTSAATHGYLPLLGRDSAIRGQLQTGIQSYRRLFGKAPTGIWLPECAYRPAYINRQGDIRPGIEYFLGQEGIKVFFSETHTITGGQPVGVAAGDVIGPYGEIKRRYVIPAAPSFTTPKRDVTTYQAYYVADTTGGQNATQHSGVSVIGRNNRTGQQVWSADWGYPGDFDYREFHKKAGTSGLQYWRVTGAKTNLAHKDYYHPEWASYKVDQHAEHFAHLVGDLLREYHSETGEFGLIASNYDTELFGHWWFEGVSWLGKVLRHLANNPDIQLTTASEYVSLHSPKQVLVIPESSWGAGGNHFTWDNGDTHWMWEPIHDAEARMEALAAKYPNPNEEERFVLNQAARELLLLESSDWPFLVTTGQAREYAIQRFSQHVERFNKLAGSLENGNPNTGLAHELYELDKVFPDIDYRVFNG
ncbi:MAG: 1,4-alpha-glucan branching protein domain-containing protein [bacterium]|nr:1,4-alpha-glucan branching protein domain-containing protein [bacterium]